MSKSTLLRNIVKLSTVKISMKITSELFELRNSPVNSTEIFFQVEENGTVECNQRMLDNFFSLSLLFPSLGSKTVPRFLCVRSVHKPFLSSAWSRARSRYQLYTQGGSKQRSGPPSLLFSSKIKILTWLCLFRRLHKNDRIICTLEFTRFSKGFFIEVFFSTPAKPK